MREYPEPKNRTWVLITHGEHKGRNGWIASGCKFPGWRASPKRKPGQEHICIKVTRQSACTGEWFTFDTFEAMSPHMFAEAQMELEFNK